MLLAPTPRHLKVNDGHCHSSKIVEQHDATIREQGYRLTISPREIVIRSSSPAGNFYAHQTLIQLRRQFPDALPCLEIEDYPDFPARGVMLDISRDKVPTLQTLYALIDRLAEWKINQLQLYMEHTFAYAGHETVWKNASPLTPEDVRSLDAYCKARFIELVPNQNSFGHMERWLKHPDYLPLAEAPNGAQTPWNFFWEGPFSLCPTDPRSLDLLRDLYSQLLPNFTSRLFNIGCDETFDLGQGRSKALCDQKGTARVYLDFLQQVAQLVKSQGRTMMFWGDIILHKPELISELPDNVIALNWGYEANDQFDREGIHFAKSKVPYYVCPGTSSWCTIAGRTDNCIGNLKNAAAAGLKYGAIGYLNTDWGDHGHLQYLPVSELGFLGGACYSWCLESNQNLDLVKALDLHAFHTTRGSLGKLAYDFGNVYQACGKLYANASALFRLIVPSKNAKPEDQLNESALRKSLAAIESALAPLDEIQLNRPDAPLIKDEFRNAGKMLTWACRRALGESSETDIEGIIETHQRLWLARNRPGGLEDSVSRLRRK